MICDLRKVEIRTDLFETNTPNVCRVNVCTRQIVDSYRGLAFLFEHFGCQEEKNLLNNAVSIWKQINLMLLKMSFKHTETISGIDSLIELLLKAMELDISIIKLLETIGMGWTPWIYQGEIAGSEESDTLIGAVIINVE